MELDGAQGHRPALSASVLRERAKAEFRDWGDLLDRVKGLGPIQATRLSAQGLTVDGAPFKAVATQPKPLGADAAHRLTAGLNRNGTCQPGRAGSETHRLPVTPRVAGGDIAVFHVVAQAPDELAAAEVHVVVGDQLEPVAKTLEAIDQ